MAPLLPGPDNSSRGTESHDPKDQRARRTALPSLEQLAEMLTQLNGLVMLGIISTPKAAVIQRGLQTLINLQLRRSSANTHGIPQETLAELCQRDPRIANLLEPFLNDEQTAWLIKGAEDHGPGQI